MRLARQQVLVSSMFSALSTTLPSASSVDCRGHIMRNPERILLPPCVTALGIDDIGCDCFTINFDAEIFQRERRRLPLVFRSYRGVVDLVVD